MTPKGIDSSDLIKVYTLSMETNTPTAQESWPPAGDDLTLDPNSLHVWRANLEVGEDRLGSLARYLSAEEKQRASRFRQERDRHHFTAARGLLRVILGRYLSLPPDQIIFSYGPRGKPFLAQKGPQSLSFNLAHSQGLALYAFAPGGKVGVDVEAVRPGDSDDEIAERFFSPVEIAEYRSLPPHQKPRAFFHCWTQKEAFIKAVGDGLSLPLDSFDVTVSPDRPARLLRVEGHPEVAAQWVIHSLHPARGFLGAVACDRPYRLVLGEWNRLDP
jgi:4'-phosphopantetheinyl transferase